MPAHTAHESHHTHHKAEKQQGHLVWQHATNGAVPEHALAAGIEDGKPTYIGKASHHGATVVGKVAPHLKGLVANVDDGSAVETIAAYEVLCGADHNLIWLEVDGGILPHDSHLVECGVAKDGSTTFAARHAFEGNVEVGVCGYHMGHAALTHHGKPLNEKVFQVLAYHHDHAKK